MSQEPVSLHAPLNQLIAAHGVPCAAEREWVVPHGRLPAARATWHPKSDSGRLDVEVLFEDGRAIIECFAGVGGGNEGIRDALQSFSANSLHVLMAALWGHHDETQVDAEQWHIQGRDYTAYIGGFGLRGTSDTEATVPDGLFTAIEAAIKGADLSADIHWFRHFFCNVANDQIFEALFDNKEWSAGLDALKSLAWAPSEEYYSVRNFLVLRAKD
ncbi:MAG: DUF6348 family protein [Pseudomonadota bacterium]